MSRPIKTYDQFIVINEAGKHKWDVVKDNLGNIRRIRLDENTSMRILNYIYDAGDKGRRYTDIVKFIVEEIKGEGPYNHEEHRGYWATNLNGSGGYWGRHNPGLLYRYCKKNDNNRWVLNNEDIKNVIAKTSLNDILPPDVLDAFIEVVE